MLTPECRVIAAVSGGPDSVCLLHALREMGANLVGVAHFNHKWRGEASEEDERFTRALASALDLPFFHAAAADGAQGNKEQAARRARIDFFRRLIGDGAADRVALGHTRDDQAETVLFRILRGSGLAGLAGIHPVTASGLIRPLIEVTRAEVEEFLTVRGIAWREDATNRDRRFARNRIRAELLPQIAREWNPRISEALAHLADLAFEEERWWAEQTWFEDAAEFRAHHLAAMPRAVARRAVRRAILRAKGDTRSVEFAHVERILDLAAQADGHGRVRVPGADATRSFEWIRVARPGAGAAREAVPVTVPVTVPGAYPAPGGAGQIRFEVAETQSPSCANLRVDLTVRLKLRAWRPGDHYHPVGRSRDQKITEMFQGARVPSWLRRSWPVVESDGRIVWARGFGPARECVAACDETPVLRIWDCGV